MTRDPTSPEFSRSRTDWTTGPAKIAAVAGLLILIGVGILLGWRRVPVWSAPSRDVTALGLQLNINTASREELELLPGIGPALAQRIIDSRSKQGFFRDVTDLQRVSGMGSATAGRLSPYIRYH